MSLRAYFSAWVSVLLLGATLVLQGQNYTQKFYTTDDGLPSNECYSVVQDSAGYIWVSTDRGLSRYNGHEFKNYGIDEGLYSTVIYKLLVSPLGGVVFYTADNHVGTIRNDSIIYFPNDTTTLIQSIYDSKKGLLIGYRDSSKYELISWRGEKLLEKRFSQGFYAINDPELGSFTLGNGMSQGEYNNFINTKGERFNLDIKTDYHHPNYYVNHYKGKGVIVNSGLLNKISPTGEIEQTKLSGVSTGGTSFIKEGILWVGLFDKGVDVISLENSDEFNLLSGFTVSSIWEDKEGSIWLTTLKNGLVKLRTSNYEGIAKGKITSMLAFNEQLVAVCDDSTLLYYDLNAKTEQKTYVDFRIADLLVINDSLFVSIDRYTELKPISKNTQYLSLSNSRMCNYQDHPVGIIYSHLKIFKNGEYARYRIHNIEPGYTYCNHVFQDTAYVGRPKGLYQVFKSGDSIHSRKISDIPVTNMCFSTEESLFATKGHGLLLRRPDFTLKERISTNQGLSGNFVSYVEQFNDSIICGTNQGVNLISNYSDKNRRKIYSSFSSDGLWSGNVTDLVRLNNELYVASDKGIQKISTENFNNPIKNPIPILEHLNGIKVVPGNAMNVKPGSNVISIGLNHIFFHGTRSFELQYRLIGQDSTWINSKSTELEFLNLSPGKYEFQYRSKLAQNDEYTTETLSFELLPLFVQTGAFKFLVAFGLLFLMAFIVYTRDKRLKLRADLLIEHEQLRYKALTSQLNPHFMFNALGSIQQLIISKKNDLAAEYLASFSGLINMTLKNTNHLFIPLANEMEFINEYVGVEKSRFEKPFDFKWTISREINKMEVLVPTMLLQPFIENSIIHGINPLKKAGKIEVSIEALNKKVLEIKIMDNGVGIVASQKTKSKRSRKSMAMENIKTRIQTMEKLYENTFHQHIEELKDEQGNVLGTLVLIDVPFKLKKEEEE